jgi:hypothetical protein
MINGSNQGQRADFQRRVQVRQENSTKEHKEPLMFLIILG